MLASLKQIEAQAIRLDAEERAKLAESMLESLRSPIEEVEKAWIKEIEERVAAYDRGDVSTDTAEDVFAQARRLTQ
ncbi:MAG: addiction module protein [Pseudomonadales bacterium]|jgi:putative addiction module component (TIGR02574 family)|nr:addiction module protein [Pseudomonadales bacterium]